MNFVILDYDRPDDLALARALGVAEHPAFAVLPPDAGVTAAAVAERRFGPQPPRTLRDFLDEIARRYATESSAP